MLRRLTYIVSVLCLLLAASSCDKTIHEYPTDCSILLNLSCEIDAEDPEFFVTVECDAKNGTSYIVRTQGAAPKNTRFDEPVKLRYIYDLYRVVASHSELVERKVEWADPSQPTPDPVQFQIQAAEYKVLVWCDYVRASAPDESWYYNTDDLRNIRYSDIEVKDNNDKDVFTNMLEVDFSEYRYADNNVEVVHDLMLHRPKGRFKCITTDMADYAKGGRDPENITAVVTYTQYVSAGYNVEEQKPNYFEFERTFFTKARIDGDGSLELCYDYIFVNGKQTNVKINFAFFDGEVTVSESGELIGEKISNWTGIVVPLKRNMETIVTGRMLTASFGTGGFGIDPGFEGEIVIPWGD